MNSKSTTNIMSIWIPHMKRVMVKVVGASGGISEILDLPNPKFETQQISFGRKTLRNENGTHVPKIGWNITYFFW